MKTAQTNSTVVSLICVLKLILCTKEVLSQTVDMYHINSKYSNDVFMFCCPVQYKYQKVSGNFLLIFREVFVVIYMTFND